MVSKESAPVVPAQAVQGGSLFVVRDHRLQRVDDAKFGVPVPAGVGSRDPPAGCCESERALLRDELDFASRSASSAS